MASRKYSCAAALQIVVRQPRARLVDFSRLKYILYGASPIPSICCANAWKYRLRLLPAIRHDRTCGTIVYLPPEDHDPAGNPRMRAAGLPMPGVELKIVDETGEALPPHVVGEVVTAQRPTSPDTGNFRRLPLRSSTRRDGCARATPDTSTTMDTLYTGPIKDMIISGAENIYPAEVEIAIYVTRM